MGNLLSNPANWRDFNGNNPPLYWNGAAYAWDAEASNWFQLELTTTPEVGDSITAHVEYAHEQFNSNDMGCLNYVDENDEVVAYYNLLGASGEIDIEVPAVRGRLILASWYQGTDAYQVYNGRLTITPPAGPAPQVSYNCDCDDDYPRTTLAELRKRLLRRLGFAAQANNPPPGMADLLDDFIRNAQEMLFRRYSVFRRERFYTWDLIPGTRMYDLDANADECVKKLDPRMISWAGISQGDDSWRPLYCGIDPVMYTSRGPGIPSHYEVRQCIELWPAPSDATWKLRIKGQFGLMPLEADGDFTTVEPEAIFLLALANAKAHYGQPDAGNYASQLSSYVRDLVRGSHMTRRYLPGSNDPRNAVRPIPVGGWPEDSR